MDSSHASRYYYKFYVNRYVIYRMGGPFLRPRQNIFPVRTDPKR